MLWKQTDPSLKVMLCSSRHCRQGQWVSNHSIRLTHQFWNWAVQYWFFVETQKLVLFLFTLGFYLALLCFNNHCPIAAFEYFVMSALVPWADSLSLTKSELRARQMTGSHWSRHNRSDHVTKLCDSFMTTNINHSYMMLYVHFREEQIESISSRCDWVTVMQISCIHWKDNNNRTNEWPSSHMHKNRHSVTLWRQIIIARMWLSTWLPPCKCDSDSHSLRFYYNNNDSC